MAKNKGGTTVQAKAKGGLSVKTFSGLNKNRMESKGSSNFGLAIRMRQGDSVSIQCLMNPDNPQGFLEFEQHVWKDTKWHYVPCLGDNCPLCLDEDQNISKTSYRFAANVWNFKEKKVMILEGPKDLSTRLFYRYSAAPEKFVKKAYDVAKYPTQPVSYDVSSSDLKPIKDIGDKKPIDLQKYVDEEARRYFGSEMPDTSALDAKDDIDEQATGLEKSKKKKGKKKKAA